MNIHKYVIPASIAAMVHVALLWFLPEEPYTPPPVEVTVKPPPIVDRPIEQPEEKPKPEAFEKEVRPLAGGPAPMSLPEVTRLPDKNVITIPVEERPTSPVRDLKVVPPTSGIGEIPGIGDRDMENIFSPIHLDRVPRARVQIPPEYPYAMKNAGVSGSVTVQFDVDTGGEVVRAEAISCSDREFVEPAVRAVRKWRFEPGRRNGKAVPFRMTIPIEFGIEQER